ncbi:hypothetical protein [Hymenobacter cheonanensis]|uniref:hypothetical protein n=1 Tax=Hymenobacter sp. CA2-7 TaxID=3063993 RepID=UPI002714265D|nr:hypothetical protein [Hymenobacter sp. CA2-7]MDO7884237.1 hypothetical protein [Hymenobacter sp. CA2-7]
MDYIKLMNRFRRLYPQARFTPSEATLYYFLMAECNSLQWKNPFGYTNGALCASISISEKTLIAARAKLQQHGLLSFRSGYKNCPTVYRLTPHDELSTLHNTASNSQSILQPIGQSKANSLENVRSSLNRDTVVIPQEIARPYERTMAEARAVQISHSLPVASASTSPAQYNADQSPLVDKEAFAQILRASNYGHVDIETYRQQMLVTARDKQVLRSLPAWSKWIITYLNNDSQRGVLLLPQTLSTTTSQGNLFAKANTQSYVL